MRKSYCKNAVVLSAKTLANSIVAFGEVRGVFVTGSSWCMMCSRKRSIFPRSFRIVLSDEFASFFRSDNRMTILSVLTFYGCKQYRAKKLVKVGSYHRPHEWDEFEA